MDLGHALYRTITGGLGPAVESAPLSKQLDEIVLRAGGKGNAARAIGISDRTLRSWYQGSRIPNDANRLRVIHALRRVRLSEIREQRLRSVKGGSKIAPTSTKIVVHLTQNYDNRERRINLTPYLRAGAMYGVIGDYLGGRDPATSFLNSIVSDGFYYYNLLNPVNDTNSSGSDIHNLTVASTESVFRKAMDL